MGIRRGPKSIVSPIPGSEMSLSLYPSFEGVEETSGRYTGARTLSRRNSGSKKKTYYPHWDRGGRSYFTPLRLTSPSRLPLYVVRVSFTPTSVNRNVLTIILPLTCEFLWSRIGNVGHLQCSIPLFQKRLC